MTEGKKAYYQVSFTGGQALAAVVVMIAALGIAFFLGTKAGFEKSGEPETAAAAHPGAVPPPVPAPGNETASASPPDASGPAEEAPVFEDREAGVTEPAKPAAAGEGASPAPSRTEIAAPSRKESAGAASRPPSAPPSPRPASAAPSGNPATASPAPAPAKEAAAETAKPPAVKGGYFVQIVSTSSKGEANRWKEKLAAKKYRTVAISSVESKKCTLWRVRVGPYPDRAQAKKAAAK